MPRTVLITYPPPRGTSGSSLATGWYDPTITNWYNTSTGGVLTDVYHYYLTGGTVGGTSGNGILIANNTFTGPLDLTGVTVLENCTWSNNDPPHTMRIEEEARFEQQLEQRTQELVERTRRRNLDLLTKAQAARERARRLLLKMLSTEQQQQLEKERYFEVIIGEARRKYRIREGITGNVRLLDAQGREVTSYCIHPSGVPIEDVMLAQKLQLETDEATFLRVANATPLRAAMTA